MNVHHNTLGDFYVIEENSNSKYLFELYTKEYIGFEIYKITYDMEKLSLVELLDDREWPLDTERKLKYHKPITTKEDLKVGDKIIFKGNFAAYEWNMGIIEEENEHLFIQGKRLHGALVFGGDDRKCWVCVGLYNPEAIKKCCFTGTYEDYKE